MEARYSKNKSLTAVKRLRDWGSQRGPSTASCGCQEEPWSKYETGSNKSDCNYWLRQERYLWRGQKVSRGRWLALREAWNLSFGTPALVRSVSLGESKSFLVEMIQRAMLPCPLCTHNAAWKNRQRSVHLGHCEISFFVVMSKHYESYYKGTSLMRIAAMGENFD